MCPDRQLLSVYLDGELPSPWKEKLVLHITGCPECQATLSHYRRLSTAIAIPLQKDNQEAAMNRVWQELLEDARNSALRQQRPYFWNRTITLPLPAFAAAAAVVLLILFLAFTSLNQRVSPSLQLESTLTSLPPDIQEIVPAAEREGVFQYLGTDRGNDIIVIQLPESRSFMSYGRPTMLKAADYSRDN